MSATKAIAKLLKLHSILKIAGVRFRRDGALMLEVKPFKNGARCPQCGRRGRRVRSRPRTRQWRDLPVAGSRGHTGYAPREIVCRTHGRTEEEIPWAARHARVSYRFEYAVAAPVQGDDPEGGGAVAANARLDSVRPVAPQH